MKRINWPIVALIVANIIWGATFPIIKLSLENIPPLSLAFIRFLLASIILYPFAHSSTHYSDLKNKWLWLYAIFGITINIIFFFIALQRTTSVNATIIASSGPIMILIGSAIFLHERVKKTAILGTIISMAGIILLIIQPLLEKGPSIEILGNLLMIVATVGSVASTIFGRKFLTAKNSLGMTFWSCFIGTLTFFPFMLKEYFANPLWMTQIDARGWLGIIFGSIFATVIAYTLYDWALAKLTAYRTGVFTYIDPIVTIAIAIPLLGEKITWPFIFGSVLVFLGIFLAEHRLHYHPLHKLFESGKIEAV